MIRALRVYHDFHTIQFYAAITIVSVLCCVAFLPRWAGL